MFEENASYYYHLSAIGTEEDQNRVFSLLQSHEDEPLDYYLSPNGPEDAPYCSYFSPKRTEVWPEHELDELMHEIALAVPNAKLQIEGANDFDASYGFIKQFIGDQYQEVRKQTYMPQLQEHRNVPFSERHTANFNTSPAIYSLTEEYENDDGIREFQILATASSKEDLRKLMRAKINKDEYGYIANNGVYTQIADHFSTNFEEGFVSYSIDAETILSPKEIDALLQTPEYMDTYNFPDNLRDVLLDVFDNLGEEKGYGFIDSAKAADTLMSDKKFYTTIRSLWWGTYTHLGVDTQKMAYTFGHHFAANILDKNPQWLEEIGAVEPFEYPDNIRNILLDSIFDVAKAYRLPVQDSNRMVDQYLRSSDLKRMVRDKLSGIRLLQEGLPGYSEANSICYAFVKDQMVPKKEATSPSLDSMISSAGARQQGRGEDSRTIPEKTQDR